MVKTSKKLMITAFAVLAVLFAGFLLLGNTRTAKAAAGDYVTLCTPGDGRIIASAGFDAYNTDNINPHYDDEDHILRVTHSNYWQGRTIANYITFIMPQQAGFTDFEGYALWVELPESTDAYSMTVMINGMAHEPNSVFGFVSGSTTDNTCVYTKESVIWKRIMNKNGFNGWIIIPASAFNGDVDITQGDVTLSILIEDDGAYTRTGTFSFDVGKIVAYSDMDSFATAITREKGRDFIKGYSSLAMKNGASIRYSTQNGYGGLRFAFSMSSADYEDLMANVGEGKMYKDLTFGLVIAPKNYTDIHAFNSASLFGYGNATTRKWYTWAGEDAEGCATILNLTRKTLVSDTEDNLLMTFYGAITDILSGNLAREFTAQGYIAYTYNGSDAVAYTMVSPYGDDIANNQRSASYIAQTVIAGGQATADQQTFLNETYIQPVEEQGKTVKYFVNHIIVAADGSSTVYLAQNDTVPFNTAVSATPQTIAGATFNADKSNVSGNALANDKLVLNLYYDLYLAGFEDGQTKGKPDDTALYTDYAISDEQYHSGGHSLKITPHPSYGTWQQLYLADQNDQVRTFDLTNVTAISFWIYYTGEVTLPTQSGGTTDTLYALLIRDADSDAIIWNSVVSCADLTPGVWRNYTVTLNHADDLSKVKISLSQTGGAYSHRETVYIDDIVFLP